MTTSGQLLGLAAVTTFLCLGVLVQKWFRQARANRVVVRQSNVRLLP